MARLFSHKHRAVHLGAFPLERLSRDNAGPTLTANESMPLTIARPSQPELIVNSMGEYINLMDRMRNGPKAPAQAPIPAEPTERSEHLQSACYYLDASMAATCRVPLGAHLAQPIINPALGEAEQRDYATGSAANPMAEVVVQEGRDTWARDEQVEALDHDFALVILTEYPRDPDANEPGSEWILGTQAERAALRGAEVGALMANYLRFLGFDARMHTATASELDLNVMAVAAGLAERGTAAASGRDRNPFIGDRYGIVTISTSMELADLGTIATGEGAKARNFKWWAGVGGARPGFAKEPFNNRPYHLGPYPMETVKRVSQPTTLIDTPNVPRMPKRHDMFLRAALGDLGAKAQKELDGFRMISKSPFGHAMMPVLGSMVPLQYGETASEIAPGADDPEKNAAAIKAALYYLGADMVGICEVPEYAWYSHDTDGSEIKPYHKYAISILIDQGYETMEGGSGDDWISGAQSMRAYMRAQLIGGVVGSHIRSLGYGARGHSVMDQDVLHIPLILNSGLGELSRIGELVLNPFVGPRFKSGIITTDMPLAIDQPIDFGLQDFCEKCTKCARECPVTAIPFGDKIMFNGYEMWKPDVEKCARYRITNAAGSMCGRCMKTCPWNLEGVMAEKPFLWSAMHLPFTRKWIAELDDKAGNGRINPVKKWWWDLDSNDEGQVIAAKKTNERQLVFRPPLTPEQQKLGCYPADIASPPASETPVSPDRKAAYVKYKEAASPTEYRAKINTG